MTIDVLLWTTCDDFLYGLAVMIPYGLIPKELEANYCVLGQWDYVVGPLHCLGGPRISVYVRGSEAIEFMA